MLKIGIIGCGKITEVRHAPEYAENPNCQLVAFFDVVPERAKALAEQYGGTAYDSIEALLASDVDAVSVCVANAYHAQASIQALKAGKHVLCEKPMATTPEDCEAMVAAAKAAGKFLMIGQNQRLAKAHVKAREIIESGEMGKVITFETHFAHPGPEGWTGVRDSWFFDKKVASFGVMADLGVHKTDLIHYLTGKKIVRTSAVLATLDKTFSDGRPITVDDNAYAIYTMEDGVVGTMHVSWTNYGNENNSTKMYMEGGVLRMYDDPKYSLIVEKRDGEVIPYELDLLTSNKEQTTGGRTSTGVIDAFVESIITNTPPAISGESAMHAMKVVFANEQSAQLGKAVDVQL
ncbi:MAG TPA: Gfo/Idh/MocA family oxidoreductase [Candidatus Pelethousia gallinarum]|nr:Gfo/Idh/MocA family oxidoreductase [Candidatus Pelethousia gallinarum]